MRTVFRALGAVSVRRKHSRSALASLDAALEVLGRGEAFAIHPEGTRSAVVGTNLAQSPGIRLPRPRRITLRFGDPLDFSRYAGLEDAPVIRRAITDEIMSAILDLSNQEYQEDRK